MASEELEVYDILPETFKTPIWKDNSSEVPLNLNKLEISLILN
jgi:hypothetical protein